MADEVEFSAEVQADAPAAAAAVEVPVVEVPAAEVAAESEPEAAPAPVLADAPAKRGRKPRAKAVPAPAADPVVAEPSVAKLAGKVRKTKAAKAKITKAKVTKAASLKVVQPKIVQPKLSVVRRPAKVVIPVPVAKPAPQAAAKPVAPRRASVTRKSPTSPSTLGAGKPKFVQFKDLTMATPFDITKIQTAFADMQGKAKAALEKGTAAVGEANAFAKGNVEAIVASGKVLSAGLQDLGATAVAETRGAFDTLTADAKELAAAKSPTEFFQLQSAIVRKQFDGAVAQASKNTEAFLKLANDAFAPLSSRVTLAVEKVSKVA